MLIDRLILGCGHLTGGASAAEAHEVLRIALAANLKHFDTAPSYGVGTAESLVGKATGGRDDVRLTLKVGSSPPRFATAATYARAALRRLRGPRKQTGPYPPAYIDAEHAPSGNFDLEFMRASITRSLGRLRRSSVDAILLHEAYPEDLTPPVRDFLAQLVASRTASRVGFSNGAVYDAQMARSLPETWIGQASIASEMFLDVPALPDRPTILHSLVKTSDWLASVNPAYRNALDHSVERYHGLLGGGSNARVVVTFCIGSQAAPGARLIYATSRADRLSAFLTAIRLIDERGLLDEINETFRSALQHAQADQR